MTMDTGLLEKKIKKETATEKQNEHKDVIKAVNESMRKEFEKIQKRMSELHKNDKETDKK